MTPRNNPLAAHSPAAVVCLAWCLASAALPAVGRAADAPDLAQALRASPSRVILADGTDAPAAACRVDRTWAGELVRSRLVNPGHAPLAVADVVLFDARHGLDPATPVYAE